MGFNTQFDRDLGNANCCASRWCSITRDRWPSPARSARCRPAAKNLVTQLSGLAKNNGDVYISVVPFEVDVNVGTSNSGASWLRWDL